jgi:hypothetical protein
MIKLGFVRKLLPKRIHKIDLRNIISVDSINGAVKLLNLNQARCVRLFHLGKGQIL